MPKEVYVRSTTRRHKRSVLSTKNRNNITSTRSITITKTEKGASGPSGEKRSRNGTQEARGTNEFRGTHVGDTPSLGYGS